MHYHLNLTDPLLQGRGMYWIMHFISSFNVGICKYRAFGEKNTLWWCRELVGGHGRSVHLCLESEGLVVLLCVLGVALKKILCSQLNSWNMLPLIAWCKTGSLCPNSTRDKCACIIYDSKTTFWGEKWSQSSSYSLFMYTTVQKITIIYYYFIQQYHII